MEEDNKEFFDEASQAKEKEKKKNKNVYLRLSGVSIQMGVIIGGFTWLGNFLDNKYHVKPPIWTICLSLFGVFASLYLLIKEINNINKK